MPSSRPGVSFTLTSPALAHLTIELRLTSTAAAAAAAGTGGGPQRQPPHYRGREQGAVLLPAATVAEGGTPSLNSSVPLPCL